jgi:hypothetical protein
MAKTSSAVNSRSLGIAFDPSLNRPANWQQPTQHQIVQNVKKGTHPQTRAFASLYFARKIKE